MHCQNANYHAVVVVNGDNNLEPMGGGDGEKKKSSVVLIYLKRRSWFFRSEVCSDTFDYGHQGHGRLFEGACSGNSEVESQ